MAEEIEAKAILEGVRLAVSNVWPNVIIESDEANIINHHHGNDFAWRIALILSNAITISTSIECVAWVHILISANSCAN